MSDNTQGSLRERLARIEMRQEAGNLELTGFREEFRKYAQIQNGRLRTVEMWQSNRSFMEKISVPAMKVLGIVVSVLVGLKVLGVF